MGKGGLKTEGGIIPLPNLKNGEVCPKHFSRSFLTQEHYCHFKCSFLYL